MTENPSDTITVSKAELERFIVLMMRYAAGARPAPAPNRDPAMMDVVRTVLARVAGAKAEQPVIDTLNAEVERLSDELKHAQRAAMWAKGELDLAEAKCPYLTSTEYANARSYSNEWELGLYSYIRVCKA